MTDNDEMQQSIAPADEPSPACGVLLTLPVRVQILLAISSVLLVLLVGLYVTLAHSAHFLLEDSKQTDHASLESLQQQQAGALTSLQTRADRIVEMNLRNQSTRLADMLGNISAVSLLTMHYEQLNQYCAGVCEAPDVVLCYIENADGEIVTTYRNTDNKKLASICPDSRSADIGVLVDALRDSKETITGEAPIDQDDMHLGTAVVIVTNERLNVTQREIAAGMEELQRAANDSFQSVRQAREAALKGFLRSLMKYLLIAGGVACVIGFIAAGRISANYARPVHSLLDVLQALAVGDYTRRMAGTGAAEFSKIANALNNAIEKQSQAITDLRDASEREHRQSEELRESVQRQMLAQEKLREAKERAEEANIAKSRFLANMSHEIRTPLNSILGYAAILMEGREEDGVKERAEYARTIQASGRHLLQLIDDVLDISKIEAGKMAVERLPCSPHGILSEVVSFLRVQAKAKNVELRCAWPEALPETILSDPRRLRQAVFNLVGNAIKFTKVGGVTIAAEIADEATDEPKLSIRVIDTGVGMTPPTLEQVFEPFVQADDSVTRRFGGSGLGLAISRHIARELGGDLTATSEQGLGSTFRLTVATGDLTDVHMVEPSAADALVREPRSEGKTRRTLPASEVLLVEDGQTNRQMISLMLRRGGVNVTTAENGLEGFEVAKSGEFDVILMDMQMPVMDGYTSTAKIRDAGIDTPIIALTAHAMTGDREKCLAAGCDDYLTKPVSPTALLSMIAQHVPAEAVEEKAIVPHEEPNAATGSLLGQVEQLLDTDDQELRAIVSEFLDGLTHRMEEIQAAHELDDTENLLMQAHRLKSASGMIGLDRLQQAASRLEDQIRENACENSILTSIHDLAQLAKQLRLGVSDEAAIAEGLRDQHDETRTADSPMIMIVDDEPVNSSLIKKRLMEAGYEHFLTIADPEDGLRLARETRPDVILLDLLMPKMSGLEFLRLLRSDEHGKAIPVIILTASAEPGSKRRAIELGATDFLEKPVEYEDLLPRVKNALTMKSQHDELLGYSNSLEEKVRRRTSELAGSRLELIHCLARAAECRDHETGRHVIRVGRYVGIIAREMGIDPATVELMEHAAPLHDVGKIGIPDSILLSPNRLSSEEFDIMKRHCEMGVRTFEPIGDDEWVCTKSHTFLGENLLPESRSPIIEMAASIALSHHEKWDGSGYPRGVKGESIPLEGRITAVADVFDALSCKRSYKDALAIDECLEVLEEGRGTHFDPQVLDAFFRSRQEILDVYERFADDRANVDG